MAEFLSRNLVCPVGYHLIGIHIGLGTGSCLPYDKRKLIDQSPIYDLIARGRYSIQFLICHSIAHKNVIGPGCRLLQYSESPHDFPGHCLNSDSDRKVLVASLCLCSP